MCKNVKFGYIIYKKYFLSIMPPKIIFIVPYRDRKEHKQFFTKYMEFIMEDYQKEDYEIYFSHQCNNLPFNRGAMKNIGFLAMREKYPTEYKNITFVFHDVDTLPYTKNILPYETITGIVKHFYGYKFALGGIFSITGADFERTNGFPNLWGWSMEDNMMQQRVLLSNLMIDRSTFFPIGSRMILQFVDGIGKLISKKEVAGFLNNNYPHGLNSIRNMNWKLEDEYIQVSSFLTETSPSEINFENYNITDPNSGKIRLTHQERYGTGIHNITGMDGIISNNKNIMNIGTNKNIMNIGTNKNIMNIGTNKNIMNFGTNKNIMNLGNNISDPMSILKKGRLFNVNR
jgi:hypothetical protein